MLGILIFILFEISSLILTTICKLDFGEIEYFIRVDNLELENPYSVQSSSLLNCAAMCSQNECCLANFDEETLECSWSFYCQGKRTTTRGKTIKRNNKKESLPNPLTDCSHVPSSFPSGIYTITLTNDEWNTISVYCNMDTDSGEWMVIQRRVNNQTDFNRSWTEYKNGFGNLQGSFWLGNDNIHTILSQRAYKVRFNLVDFNGDTAYAEYSTFHVAEESTNYSLTISGYSGTAGDSMMESVNIQNFNLNGKVFSTWDRDNDDSFWVHCADAVGCGWWMNFCTNANINGMYDAPDGQHDGMYWYDWKGYVGLKWIEMKIKPV